MKRNFLLLLLFFFILLVQSYKQPGEEERSWVRINQLGYLPSGTKVAVWCSKDSVNISTWQLVDAQTKKFVSTGKSGKAFGAYGPFKQSYRLNFSHHTRPGK